MQSHCPNWIAHSKHKYHFRQSYMLCSNKEMLCSDVVFFCSFFHLFSEIVCLVVTNCVCVCINYFAPGNDMHTHTQKHIKVLTHSWWNERFLNCWAFSFLGRHSYIIAHHNSLKIMNLNSSFNSSKYTHSGKSIVVSSHSTVHRKRSKIVIWTGFSRRNWT